MEVIDTGKLSGGVPARKGFSAFYNNNSRPNSLSGSVRGTGTGGCVDAMLATARRPEPHNPISNMLSASGDSGSRDGVLNRGRGGGGDSSGSDVGGGRNGGDGSDGYKRLSQQVAVVVAAPSISCGNTALMKPPTSTPSSLSTAVDGKKADYHLHPNHHHTGVTTAVTSARNSPSLVKLTAAATTTTADLTSDSHPTATMDKRNDNVSDTAAAVDSHSDNGDDDKANNNTIREESIATTGAASTSTTATTATPGVTAGTETGGGPIRNLRVRGQRKFLPEKTRHKRQTLQDMTRPLKQWLLRHKDNPYPSKAEKMDLVSRSQMTLTQVSNWFANARRRLKNTVKQPDLTWASRIKLYNSCVEGNAELFSICSDDSCPDSDHDMMEHRQSDTFHDDVTDSLTSSRTATPDMTAASGDTCGNLNHGSNSGSHSSSSSHSHTSHSQHAFHHAHSTNSNSSSSSVPSSGHSAHHHYPGLDDTCVTFPKYKHSILHRYLSDAHQQALILDEDSVAKSRDRHHSSSTGSRDFEELSTSSVSSPAHESLHHDHLDDFSEEFETMALRRRTSDVSRMVSQHIDRPFALHHISRALHKRMIPDRYLKAHARSLCTGEILNAGGEEDMYWKEIGAALALTSLARGRAVNTT